MSNSKFKLALKEGVAAYADCNGAKGVERNLDFVSGYEATADEYLDMVRAAIPDGYNAFDEDVAETVTSIFGDDAKYFFARESSVCLYIKPAKNTLHLSRIGVVADIQADEFTYDEVTGLVRIWWD